MLTGVAVGSFEEIGDSGTGILNQSGGTNSCYEVVLGNSSGGSGTYNLSGGLLNVAALSQGSGTATFNFSGGTFQAATGLSTSVPVTLKGPATYDTNGNSINIVNSITGSGSLTKINPGTLTLQSINIYSGGTNVAGGVLALSVGATLGSGPVLVSGGTLDVTQSPVSIASLVIATSGALNLAMDNPLTISGSAGFGGILNLSGSPAGASTDLINYSSAMGAFSAANVPFGYMLEYNPSQLDLVQTLSSVGVWANAANGSWVTRADWISNSVPSGRNVARADRCSDQFARHDHA